MNFWNVFKNLCDQNNTTPNAICKELNFSNATATHWKNGTVPKGDALILISDYFHVSVDYLLGRIDSPNGYNNNQIHNSDNVALGENAQVNVNAAVKSYDEMTAELIKRFQSLSFDEKIEVFNYIKNIK